MFGIPGIKMSHLSECLNKQNCACTVWLKYNKMSLGFLGSSTQASVVKQPEFYFKSGKGLCKRR